MRRPPGRSVGRRIRPTAVTAATGHHRTKVGRHGALSWRILHSSARAEVIEFTLLRSEHETQRPSVSTEVEKARCKLSAQRSNALPKRFRSGPGQHRAPEAELAGWLARACQPLVLLSFFQLLFPSQVCRCSVGPAPAMSLIRGCRSSHLAAALFRAGFSPPRGDSPGTASEAHERHWTPRGACSVTAGQQCRLRSRQQSFGKPQPIGRRQVQCGMAFRSLPSSRSPPQMKL